MLKVHWQFYQNYRHLRIPDTYEVRIAKNRQLLDNPPCNSAMECVAKLLFVRFSKDGILAELQARTSRSCIFFAIFASLVSGILNELHIDTADERKFLR